MKKKNKTKKKGNKFEIVFFPEKITIGGGGGVGKKGVGGSKEAIYKTSVKPRHRKKKKLFVLIIFIYSCNKVELVTTKMATSRATVISSRHRLESIT
jgi:hypothetical protein